MAFTGVAPPLGNSATCPVHVAPVAVMTGGGGPPESTQSTSSKDMRTSTTPSADVRLTVSAPSAKLARMVFPPTFPQPCGEVNS